MVLLSVLGTLTIIYIMIIQMSADVVFTSKYYQQVMFRERSYYLARSAMSGVMQIFALDNNDYDSLDDEWAQEIPPFHLEEEHVYLSFYIEDLDRYFNPNSIIQENGEVEEKHLKQFRRLLEVLDLDPDFSNPILDWMDGDQERRLPLGAEGLDYENLPVKEGPLDSLEEIRLIKGITKEMYNGRVEDGLAFKGLKDVMSVYASGNVNVNTADREVLMSLDEEVTEDVAAEIIRKREDKPFEKMDDLLELAGMSHDLLFRIKQLADVKSEYFKIVLTIENYDGDTADLTVITKRSGQSSSIIFWKVE